MTKASGTTDKKRHPIEVVARRTGLTKDLLRAWERRYGVVDPGRTDTGRRLYSDQDVHRLTLLARATGAGRPISLVAGSPIDELESMVQDDASMGSAPASTNSTSADAAHHVDACLAAIKDTDQTTLRRFMRRAALALSPSTLIEDVVAPLMRRVGEMWWEQSLDPGQERLASQAAREILNELIEAFQDETTRRPRLLTATPPRQPHELGSMLAAASAASVGWAVTHLGSDLPVKDIARAASAVSADAVALSLVFPDDDPDLPEDLRRLRKLLPDVAIVVGGRATAAYGDALEEIGATVVKDLADFRREISTLPVGRSRERASA